MKKIITVVIIIFILGTGTAVANTGEKNPFLAVWKSISNLQNKNDELERKISCLELVKQTPDRGPGEWINIDIVGFYEESQRRLGVQRTNPSRPEEQNNEITFWESVLTEAQPMYNRYIEECK